MKARHLRVLKEITDSIPRELIDNLMVKEKQFATLKQIVEVALTKPDSEVPAKQKERMKAALDAGYLDREIEVINTPIEKQIDEYMSKAVAQAVKDGRLPKKAPKMKLINNKGKQYARRKHKQLKELVQPEGKEGNDRKDDLAHQGEDNSVGNDVPVLPRLGIEEQ